MRKALLMVALLPLIACNKSSAPGSSAAAGNPNDPVEKKLLELAGSGASNCGHLKAQVVAEMDTAGKCVMQAAQQRKPFYVAYDLPGMTIGIAGNAEGKQYSLQTQPSATGGINAVPCPNELRIAPSGRATCYAPGTFPMSAGSDTHGGGFMQIPTMSGAPPAGTPNPHQPKPAEKQK